MFSFILGICRPVRCLCSQMKETIHRQILEPACLACGRLKSRSLRAGEEPHCRLVPSPGQRRSSGRQLPTLGVGVIFVTSLSGEVLNQVSGNSSSLCMAGLTWTH